MSHVADNPTPNLDAPRRTSWKRWVVRFVVLYILFVVLLMIFENRFIYRRGGRFRQPAADFVYEESWLTTRDGVKLHAWFCPTSTESASSEDRLVVMYLHGTYGELSWRHRLAKLWHVYLDADVLLFDYRGYGQSDGEPTEEGLYEDAWAAFHYLTDERGVSPENIVLVGRSLGGAVAIELASRLDTYRALILESTFTSIPDVASRIVPIVPVYWLMRNRYPSLDRISELTRPVFFTHGDEDILIPFEHTQRLFDRARGPKELHVLHGRGHWSLPGKRYYEKVKRFLSEHAAPSTRQTLLENGTK